MGSCPDTDVDPYIGNGTNAWSCVVKDSFESQWKEGNSEIAS